MGKVCKPASFACVAKVDDQCPENHADKTDDTPACPQEGDNAGKVCRPTCLAKVNVDFPAVFSNSGPTGFDLKPETPYKTDMFAVEIRGVGLHLSDRIRIVHSNVECGTSDAGTFAADVYGPGIAESVGFQGRRRTADQPAPPIEDETIVCGEHFATSGDCDVSTPCFPTTAVFDVDSKSFWIFSDADETTGIFSAEVADASDKQASGWCSEAGDGLPGATIICGTRSGG